MMTEQQRRILHEVAEGASAVVFGGRFGQLSRWNSKPPSGGYSVSVTVADLEALAAEGYLRVRDIGNFRKHLEIARIGYDLTNAGRDAVESR